MLWALPPGKTKMAFFNWKNELSRDGHRVALSGLSMVMHCHHYNINLQKTLEDTLGDEGVRLMVRSVEEAGRHIFHSLFSQFDQIRTEKSKLEMAASMYQNCGLGIVRFQDVSRDGGKAVSPSNHHVTGWLAKHGRRSTPGCHFTRGWLAGLFAAMFDRPVGHYLVVENHCKMVRDPECIFEIRGAADGH
jgi:hypothetical protein